MVTLHPEFFTAAALLLRQWPYDIARSIQWRTGKEAAPDLTLAGWERTLSGKGYRMPEEWVITYDDYRGDR